MAQVTGDSPPPASSTLTGWTEMATIEKPVAIIAVAIVLLLLRFGEPIAPPEQVFTPNKQFVSV